MIFRLIVPFYSNLMECVPVMQVKKRPDKFYSVSSILPEFLEKEKIILARYPI